MLIDLSDDELRAVMMLNLAGISFLENIDTGKLRALVERLESALPRN